MDKSVIIIQIGELFANRGIKSITMDDICHKLGISKKTLYKYFHDKDDLVQIIMNFRFEVAKSELLEISNRSNNPIVALNGILNYLGSRFINVNLVFIHDLEKYFDIAWNEYMVFKENTLINLVRAKIENGKENGLFRNEINSDFISRLGLMQMELLINRDVFSYSKVSIQEAQKMLTSHFLFGLVTAKGLGVLTKHLI